MPNIVNELIIELARVQRLLPLFGEERQREAKNVQRYGREQMALNSYEGMRESISDLKEFVDPRSPSKPLKR